MQIHLIGIHQITTVSVIKRLSLYEFTLWGLDLVSVVRIREGPYYRGFSFKENNYMRMLSEHWKLSLIEVSILERCPYREVQLYMFGSFWLVFLTFQMNRNWGRFFKL